MDLSKKEIEIIQKLREKTKIHKGKPFMLLVRFVPYKEGGIYQCFEVLPITPTRKED